MLVERQIAEERNEEREIPQNSSILVIFKKNAPEEIVFEEKVTVSSFEKSRTNEELVRQVERLRKGQARILERKKRVLRRKKHGGRRYSQVELRRMGKQIESDKEAFPAGIKRFEKVRSRLKGLLAVEELISPLAVRITDRIEIQEENLSGEKVAFWRFVESEAPEVWNFVEREETKMFKNFYNLFIFRFEVERGTPAERQKAAEARDKLIDQLATLDLSSEEEAVFAKITRYFEKN